MADQRASEQLLDGLHNLVATTLVEQLRIAKAATDENGNPVPIPASLIAQAAKFLKDNGVDRAIRAGDPLDILNDELPLLDVENGS